MYVHGEWWAASLFFSYICTSAGWRYLSAAIAVGRVLLVLHSDIERGSHFVLVPSTLGTRIHPLVNTNLSRSIRIVCMLIVHPNEPNI